MTGTIFLAYKHLATNGIPIGAHMYLVYSPTGTPDNPGDPSTWEFISGEPTGSGLSPADLIQIQAQTTPDYTNAYDHLLSGQTTTTQDFTPLDLGGVPAATVWGDMVAAVQALGTTSGNVTTTNIPYNAVFSNSNSVAAYALNAAGITPILQPPLDGVTGDPISLSTTPAWDTQLEAPNSSTTFDLNSFSDSQVVAGQGPDDTFTVDVGSHTTNSSVTINESSQSGSDNALVLQDVDPTQIQISRNIYGDVFVDVNGKWVATIVDQFKGAYPRVDHIHVEPTSGSPFDISLTDPTKIAEVPILPDSLALAGLYAGFLGDAFSNTLGEALQKYVPWLSSPLVINLNGTGLAATTSLNDGTMFDLQNNGYRRFECCNLSVCN